VLTTHFHSLKGVLDQGLHIIWVKRIRIKSKCLFLFQGEFAAEYKLADNSKSRQIVSYDYKLKIKEYNKEEVQNYGVKLIKSMQWKGNFLQNIRKHSIAFKVRYFDIILLNI